MKKSIWTKKNAGTLNNNDLMYWFKKCEADLLQANRLKVKMPATEKAFKALTAVALDRNLI
jgi:hypothetical protein